jgi:hypothetical protein
VDAVRLNAHQLHMPRVGQQPVLQVAPHAVGDSQRDNQRCHASGHAGNGDGSHYAHHGLAPLGFQVPHRQKKLESHQFVPCCRV